MLAPPRGNAGSSSLKRDFFCVDVDVDDLCFFSGRALSAAASFLRLIGAIVVADLEVRFPTAASNCTAFDLIPVLCNVPENFLRIVLQG